jgi:cell division transport system permease protein
MDIRAVINGTISAGIAIVLLFIMMKWAENQVPQLKTIHSGGTTIALFSALIILGVAISVFSTHRSVMKYLKMTLDDLY